MEKDVSLPLVQVVDQRLRDHNSQLTGIEYNDPMTKALESLWESVNEWHLREVDPGADVDGYGFEVGCGTFKPRSEEIPEPPRKILCEECGADYQGHGGSVSLEIWKRDRRLLKRARDLFREVVSWISRLISHGWKANGVFVDAKSWIRDYDSRHGAKPSQGSG